MFGLGAIFLASFVAVVCGEKRRSHSPGRKGGCAWCYNAAHPVSKAASVRVGDEATQTSGTTSMTNRVAVEIQGNPPGEVVAHTHRLLRGPCITEKNLDFAFLGGASCYAISFALWGCGLANALSREYMENPKGMVKKLYSSVFVPPLLATVGDVLYVGSQYWSLVAWPGGNATRKRTKRRRFQLDLLVGGTMALAQSAAWRSLQVVALQENTQWSTWKGYDHYCPFLALPVHTANYNQYLCFVGILAVDSGYRWIASTLSMRTAEKCFVIWPLACVFWAYANVQTTAILMVQAERYLWRRDEWRQFSETERAHRETLKKLKAAQEALGNAESARDELLDMEVYAHMKEARAEEIAVADGVLEAAKKAHEEADEKREEAEQAKMEAIEVFFGVWWRRPCQIFCSRVNALLRAVCEPKEEGTRIQV